MKSRKGDYFFGFYSIIWNIVGPVFKPKTIYICLVQQVSLISNLLTKLFICFKEQHCHLFANHLRAQYIQEAQELLWVTMMFVIMEHKPKTKYISPERKHHTICEACKVRKRKKIRNRYNQAPHLTQDTNRKVTTSQLDITDKSQEVSPFQAGDHKASTTIRA